MRGTETITVIPQVVTDRLRDPSGAAEPPYDIEGCIVWPRQSEEEGKGWVQIDGENVFAPPGSVVPATARVELRGKTYDVEGSPGDYRLRGRQKGILIVLKSVSGPTRSA